MISLRIGVLAVAILALAGCSSSEYYDDGYYGYPGVATPYPYSPYYDGYPYFGYGYGGYPYYHDYFDDDDDDYDDDDRFFQPSRHVKCDRLRDVCYDRHGLSYDATRHFLGDRAAKHAFKEHGEGAVQFSPKKGIICDRRTRACSDEEGLDARWTGEVFGDQARRRVGNAVIESPAARSNDNENGDRAQRQVLNRSDDEEEILRMRPNRQDDDMPASRRLQSPIFGDDGPAVMRAQPDNDRPNARSDPLETRQQFRRERGNASGGSGCPPRGCTD
jgi:Fels-1 Prophage Protein-like